MSILKILKYPDPRLKIKAKEVIEINDVIKQNINGMIETMYHDNGGGLAAIQVALPIRIFTMDATSDKSNPQVFFIAVILEKEGSIKETDRCLSFPGVEVTVERAQRIKIQALDKHGNKFTEEYFNDYSCRCVQHEIDHLNGITFFDRISPLKRKMVEKKYKVIQKQKKHDTNN